MSKRRIIVMPIAKNKVCALALVLLLAAWNDVSALGKKRNAMSVAKWNDFGKDLAMDVYENNGNIIVKMNVPGISENNIQVRIENGNLHVSGKREEKKEVKEKDYYHKEIKRGDFSRIISLPEDIDENAMTWEVTDGVLTVTIPKE